MVKLQPPLRIAQGFPGSSIVCSPEEQQRQRQQQEQQGPPFSNMYDKAGSGSGSRSVSSIRDISNMPGTSHRSSSFNPSNQETPSRPQTPPQEASSSTPVIAPASAPVIHTKFEAVAAHTAKCDLCNTSNDSGMSRCQSCGWQSCHACKISTGCTRMHNYGSRTHANPIDRVPLVSSKIKGKKKSQGRPKSQPTRVFKWERGRDQSQLRERAGANRKANTPSPSPAATATPSPSFNTHRRQSPYSTSKDPSSAIDGDFFENEKYFEGVRDLYAFSIEAYGVWTNDQRDRNPAQRWRYHAVRLEEIHEHALLSATRAVLEFRRQEAEGS